MGAVVQSRGARWTEDGMTEQQPVEPDAIIGRDGAAVPGPRGHAVAPQPLPALIPALARVAIAGPLLTA